MHSLALALVNDTGITKTAAGPALQLAETRIGTLARSFMVCWQGIPVSVPFAILARRYDMLGRGTAAITGLLVPFIVIGGVHGFGIEAVFFIPGSIPGSVVPGVAFWLTVRLIHAVRNLLDTAHERVTSLLSARRGDLERGTHMLPERQTIHPRRPPAAAPRPAATVAPEAGRAGSGWGARLRSAVAPAADPDR
ncbi:hypothetical protein GE300_18040 [Rhodobacteraceae bacterium 2CG4]|uniref:Uncharacterized protein n=1 Tax=Halovulum marinum TaxID=2662447 RepID=A0A6L5Z4K4_9RHOB|nr:hypothetical protein [Halovulum marinum]MSU91483.1 hypothetical protein [Halovulum marinum]